MEILWSTLERGFNWRLQALINGPAFVIKSPRTCSMAGLELAGNHLTQRTTGWSMRSCRQDESAAQLRR